VDTVVEQATRLPLPLVLALRRRTVAKVDSIGLLVREWTESGRSHVR
jgi:hypothetical protein